MATIHYGEFAEFSQMKTKILYVVMLIGRLPKGSKIKLVNSE